jgi:type I restriction enzyme, R subunit
VVGKGWGKLDKNKFASFPPISSWGADSVLNEADTCRRFVVPKLQVAGWDNEPHSIAEQRTVTDGRIVPVGKGFIRKPPKRVDFLLRYTRDFPLAVVETSGTYKAVTGGLQHAKQYTEMLGLKFATRIPRAASIPLFTADEKLVG